MIKKKFKTPLYGVPFTVIIYKEHSEIEKFFEKSNFEPSKEHDGWVATIDSQLYLVFLAQDKGYPTAGIIAHEAKHLVNNIFIEICHELDRYNDEPECYLLGWIVDEIHKLKEEYFDRKKI